MTMTAAALLALCSSLAGVGQVELEVVAKDGDPAPGTTGTFRLNLAVNGPLTTAIDADAQVYFYAVAEPPGAFPRGGIWFGEPGFVNEVAIDGDVLTGFEPPPEDCIGFGAGCGEIFNTQPILYLTASGRVHFRASRADNIAPLAYLAGFGPSPVEPLLTSAQVQLSGFPFRALISLETEAAQFMLESYIGSQPFGAPNGGLTDFTTALIGAAAPEITDPVTVLDVFGTVPSTAGITFGFNQNAERLFVAELSDMTEALYYQPAAPNPIALLARSGQPTPDIDFGAFLPLTESTSLGRGGHAQINDAGQGYFVARWRDPEAPFNNNNLPRLALWRFAQGGFPQLVASEYLNINTDLSFATSEFDNTAFDHISRPNISTNGDIYFYAIGRERAANGVPDATDERVGLWRAPANGGPPELAWRVSTSDSPGSSLPNGPDVPGTPLPGGGYFTGLGISGYGLDEHGHLVFSTNNAIYAEDGEGPRRVLANGQAVDVDGNARTVAQIRVNTVGFISSTMQSYRNHRMALRARFTDGSDAILRTRFKPAPRLIGLEAVQVIQDWDNSVPLYAGKQTLVRAHLQAAEVQLAPIVLRAFDAAGDELPYSPVRSDLPGELAILPAGMIERSDLETSANFTLPAQAVAGAEVSVKVENSDGLLLCQEAAGPAPNDCALTLSFTTPSKPQLKIVTIDWFHPELGLFSVDRAARMELVERWISASPIAEVDWTDAAVGISGTAKLDPSLLIVSRLKAMDQCYESDGCKVMYYGAIRGFQRRGAALVPLSLAAGFVSALDKGNARHTMTHELSHVLGQRHTVADPPTVPLHPVGFKQGPCGSLGASMAPAFPYLYEVAGFGLRPTLGPMDQGQDRLAFGFEWERKRVVEPTGVFALMSYCWTDVFDRWPSTHTYPMTAAALATRFPTNPMKTGLKGPMPGDHWLISGTVKGSSVELDPLLLLPVAPEVSPPGPFQVNVRNASGQVLATTSFEPQGEDSDVMFFLATVAIPAGAHEIRLVEPLGAVVATLTATANAPTAQIISPNGGEVLDAPETVVSWQADDLDGDTLSHSLQFSSDNGATWETLVTDWPEQSYTIKTELLRATDQGLVRVQTSDGFHAAIDDSDAVFEVADSAPTVVITAPATLRTFYSDQPIRLNAAAYDTEDGVLDAAAVDWSSDVDGPLGQGLALDLSASGLTIGDHVITAVATDSAGLNGNAQVAIAIELARPPELADLALDLITGLETPPPAEDEHSIIAQIQNRGPDPAGDVALQISLDLTAFATEPGAVAELRNPRAPPGWDCRIDGSMLSCDPVAMAAFASAEVGWDVLVDRPAVVNLTATVGASVADHAGANNHSSVSYPIAVSDRVFGDGFEAGF